MSVSQMTLFLISCWYCHEKEQQQLKNYILHWSAFKKLSFPWGGLWDDGEERLEEKYPLL